MYPHTLKGKNVTKAFMIGSVLGLLSLARTAVADPTKKKLDRELEIFFSNTNRKLISTFFKARNNTPKNGAVSL